VPRRAESDTKDSACTTAEHEAHRHVVENSQPEHEPNWNADQHAYNKPCADGQYGGFIVVRHTIMMPNEPPRQTSFNTANLQGRPDLKEQALLAAAGLPGQNT
jgi:hypothetical protein